MITDRKKVDTVSVVIPVYNEEKYISSCIDSILKQDYDFSKIEIIFIDGNSTDRTKQLIHEKLNNSNANFKILDNFDRITPKSLNIGIRYSKNDIVIRLDAHSEYPKNYISKCVYYINNIDADNVGCILETKSTGVIGNAISSVLSSKFGVGNSNFRTNAKSGYTDTVPFGTFRKSLFDRIGYFNERLPRNQDSELNSRIIKNGGKIYLFNDIKLIYHPRNTIKGLIKMAMLNGKWNLYTNYLVPGSMKLRHFIPFLFVISLIIGFLSMIFKISLIQYAFWIELLLYMLLNVIYSFKDIKEKKILNALLCLIIYPIFHVTYGIGTFEGIFFIVNDKRKENNKMTIYEKLINKKEKLALVGLGYVGMPIAIAFANKGIDVIGFDLNKSKIDLYKSGVDPTKEVGDEAIKKTTLEFTSDEKRLKDAKFIIVAVPTPVNLDHTPDLAPVEGASEIVGRNLSKGSIVVFESTVYPGVTEDVCIPIMEKESGLKCGVDFKVGYSPERINPGDKVHRLENIHKIVSGMDEESLKEIKNVYDLVIEVGTHPVSNIKTAEAIKVVENSQRDINIAFMNELAMVFDKMGIDTNEVVDGMNTKWNALGFRPGLVGGHCIGVDPYYFTYEAEKLGYHSQIILNGRIVNDSMGNYIADAAIKQMIEVGQAPKKSNVVILGLTFKENCPDTRNSKVNDIIRRLNEYGIKPIIVDPWANENDAKKEYGVELTKLEEVKNADCIIVAVAHNEFKKLSLDDLKRMYKNTLRDEEKVLIDVKGLYNVSDLNESKMKYWRL